MDYSRLYFDKNQAKAIPLSLDAFAQKFNVNFTDELIPEGEILDKIAAKCQKLLKKPKVLEQNQWICALYKNDLLAKKTPRLMVKWIDHRLGYGLFAAETIPAFTYIGEYAGILRPRIKKIDRYNDYAFSYTIAHKDTPFVIDAKQTGGLIRFINHSDSPKCASHWLIENNLCHIIFHTKEAIPAGAQLTYDYGPYYWRSRTIPTQI